MVDSVAQLQPGQVVRITLDSLAAGSGAAPIGGALNGNAYAGRAYAAEQAQVTK